MPNPKINDLDKNIDLVLAVINELLIAGLLEDIFEGSLTEAQIKCLLFIVRNQTISKYDKIRISDVSDALNISLPAATKAVNRLLEKGLIKKERDNEDYRNIIIKPTDKGKEYSDKFNRERKKRITGLYKKCTEEEFDIIVRASEIFIEKNIKDLDKTCLLRICRHCGIGHYEDCVIKKKLDSKG